MNESHPVLTKDSIFRELQSNRGLLDRYGVRKIALFGSYAAGKQTRESDIDLYVDFDQPTLHNYMGLCRDLETLFQRKVDVLTPGALETIRVPEVAESIRKSLTYG